MKKPLLTIALGTTFAIAATGTAISLTAPGGLTDQVPGGAPLPACSDLADNDGDGQSDYPTDPGCSGPLDGDEYNPPPAPPPSGGGGAGGGGAPGGGSSGGGETVTAPAAEQTTTGKTGGLFDKRGGKGGNPQAVAKGEKKKIQEDPPLRNPDGSPTNRNPGLTIAQFGPAPIGVPNFVIDQFEIPPFLLPLFQSYGAEYGIPWQVLAAISKHESDHCRLTDLVSSAGAVGCMQFLPSTWRAYGVDANEDGVKDPYNPVDSIAAAARYLRACAGDLPEKIHCYNHADWYVDLILSTANEYSKLPTPLIGSLTGLADNTFPVAADATYANDVSEREAIRKGKATGNAPQVITDAPTRRGINIYSSLNAPVVAVNDGVIQDMGQSPRLGNYIVLRDAYGNRYTYAQLGSVSKTHPVSKEGRLTASDLKLVGGKQDKLLDGKQVAQPKGPATAGGPQPPGDSGPSDDSGDAAKPASGDAAAGPVNTEELRTRLFALPEPSTGLDGGGVSDQLESVLAPSVPGYEVFKSYVKNVFKFDPGTMELRQLRKGSKVTAGTVLGRVGEQANGGKYMHFAIKPTGRGAKTIDPKPILDSWKLNETIGVYRAADQDPFDSEATVGQILLMSKDLLIQRVLADPRVEIYSCGRTDIQSGQIDRRILATLEYLAERGYRLTVTSLKCGHSFYTTSGNVSAHSYGAAVDIAAVNGIPILDHQGPGSITELVIRDLLLLQGTMAPNQIISLMDFGGATFAMGDHADHIHVGFSAPFGLASGQADVGTQLGTILRADQWERLIGRLGEIENPDVSAKPSKFSTPAGKKSDGPASSAHQGE